MNNLQQLMIIVESELVPHHVQHMTLELMKHDYGVDPVEPIGVEKPQQVKYGPQHNTRKGKQKRW